MLFAVPTMYHRLAAEAEEDPEVARGFASARLLVSGSAALPAADHERIERLTGQQIAERYGMTETLMNTGVRASGERRPGYVGPPLTASTCGSWTTTATRSRTPTTRRSARSTSAGRTCSSSTSTAPTPRPRRWSTAGSDRRPRHARAGRLHPHRRAPRDRPDQERRLQDRRRRDRGRAARAPGRRGGRGHRRARPRPRRADRRVGRRAEGESPSRGRAGRPRRRPAHAAQAPARRALRRRAAAQRDGQGAEEAARGIAEPRGTGMGAAIDSGVEDSRRRAHSGAGRGGAAGRAARTCRTCSASAAQHVLAMFGATALVPVLTGFPVIDDAVLVGHRHDPVQPAHAQPRAVLHRLELRVHRAGDGGARRTAAIPAALGGIMVAGVVLFLDRPARRPRRLPRDRVPAAAGRDRRDRRADRPQPRAGRQGRSSSQQAGIAMVTLAAILLIGVAVKNFLVAPVGVPRRRRRLRVRGDPRRRSNWDRGATPPTGSASRTSRRRRSTARRSC